MGNSEVLSALNSDLANELASAIQFADHARAAQVAGLTEQAEVLRTAASEEVRHAERLAERIVQLSGKPTSSPALRQVIDDPRQMLREDLQRKQMAVEDYHIHIRICSEHVDPVTRLMLEQILTQEERHAYEFSRLRRTPDSQNGALKAWQLDRQKLLKTADVVA